MQTIVFFGDSLTEGKIGASYVERLRVSLAGEARIVNAGVNGDTVVNLRRRVARDVVPHQPDLVVIHTGLNDLGTAYALPLHRAYYRFLKGMAVELTPRRFANAYRALIADLRAATTAQIVLCTPTTLTEGPDDPVQPLIDAYVAIIQALADQEGLPLIDLRASFLRAISADPRPGPPYHVLTAIQDMLSVRLGHATYPELAARRGYRLLCDGVHLADAGADLAAQTLLPPLRALITQHASHRPRFEALLPAPARQL